MMHQPAFAPDPPTPTPDHALATALADELVLLTTMLSDLAYDLASDPQTLRRHLESLQAIDHITQSQTAIANILRSTDNPHTRLAEVTLEDMAQRLKNRLG